MSVSGRLSLDTFKLFHFQDLLQVQSQPFYLNKLSRITWCNRPFSYSEKESQSNETLLYFVEVSNVHNSDGSFNATQSNLVYENV